MVSVGERIKDIYRTEYKRRPVSTFFLTILIVFFAVFAVLVIITGGDALYNMFNANHSLYFSDHFDSVFYSYDRPYTFHHVIYPPLVTVFYAVLGDFIIPYVDIPGGMFLTPELIRDSQMGILSFMIITAVTFYALFVIFSRLMKNADVRKELLFLFTILLAYPFVYAVERGNSIIMALVFCFFFLLGYRSENKYVRCASYIALGIAAGIKLYPAILWLLIVRERRYREAAVCMTIVAALIFLPFLLTDGDPMILLDSIGRHTEANLGFTNIDQIITAIFREGLGVSAGIVAIIKYAAIGAFTLLSFIVILFDKEMKFWKILTVVSCNLILGLGVGVQYQTVYMIIPILYFLAAEKEMSGGNMFYAACFAMMMAFIPVIEFAGLYPSAMAGAVESAFIIIVAIAVLREGLKRIYHKRSVNNNNADVSA